MVNMGLLHLVCFLAVAMHETALGFAPRPKSSFCGGNSNLGIKGGHQATIKDVPFIVAINEVDANDELTVFCGGTIIHERFILTAASCFDGAATANRTILWSTKSLADADGGFLTAVEGKFCHEHYDERTLINDICLLKVEKAFPFHWLVKADLPDEDFELQEGTWVNVTGWGATQSSLDMEDELRQVTVPIRSQACCDIYEDFNDDQICAGQRRRDFCTGDMGGPMTINNLQVGVISGSGECGSGPGVYTRVSSYVDWIESTIDNNL